MLYGVWKKRKEKRKEEIKAIFQCVSMKKKKNIRFKA